VTFLVTGANGFIGRRLCAALEERGKVRALLREPVEGPWSETVVADIADGVPAQATSDAEVVFHLAARAHAVDDRETNAAYRAVNVEGTRALLERARDSRVRRLVFMSSVKAIGEGGAGVIDDDTTPHPTTAYGRTKQEAERLVLDGGFVPEPVVLRPCLVYGPGVKGNILRMVEAIDAGRFPPVPQLRNRRSMVHVDDVVAAALGAAEAGAVVGRPFIVSDNRYYSSRDIYEAISRELGRKVRPGLPLSLFRALAKGGDLVGAVTGRGTPFDTAAYDKLFGSAAYDGSGLWRALGTGPKWTLETALPAIVEAFHRQ
jgi:UDP-glucose 4-epimerase